jgi:pimeloyl-ACP methyl ester carboxylesterase
MSNSPPLLNPATPAAPHGETVILLHGILNPALIMAPIARRLRREGYRVINWGYPGRSRLIEEHAAGLNTLVRSVEGDGPIHFVGFSLGGVVIRYYLTQYDSPRAGRLVMIASPNLGTAKVDVFYSHGWFRRLYGTKAMAQLRASNRRFFDDMGVPKVEFGVIAGGRGDVRGYSRLLEGDDDGAVPVESAKLDGAADFILLFHTHTVLVLAPATARQVAAFLRTGRFVHRYEEARPR